MTAPSLQKAARNPLRSLPAVSSLVERLRQLEPKHGHVDQDLLTFLARRLLADHRQTIRAGRDVNVELDTLTAELSQALERWHTDSATCRVINATGIVLHSGLGRAVLAPKVIQALARLDGYSLLEVDREEGRRRRRDAFLEELLVHLTGAEAATVVNNNAAATLLALNTLAAGRDVLVSRAQMVEIGGSFRIPDVMETSGCRLREVGTTNRTYAADYERAIDPGTGALMLVHTSNYRIVGFTEQVEIDALVTIGAKHDLPVLHDLGSGSLLAPETLGVGDEPPVKASVRAGADVICFSGDKMIGGVQAGILVGKKAWIDRLRRNPLARALRIDKLTCVALEAALKLYFEPSTRLTAVPTLRMLTATPESLEERARALATAVADRCERSLLEIGLESATSEAGSGALPAIGLPTTCVTIRVAGIVTQALARDLRLRSVPIFTRLKDDRLWLDVRTLQEGDAEEIVRALAGLAPRSC